MQLWVLGYRTQDLKPCTFDWCIVYIWLETVCNFALADFFMNFWFLGTGGICWASIERSGRCKELTAGQVTKEECCSASQPLAAAWSPDDLDSGALFFWRVLGGGVPCNGCRGISMFHSFIISHTHSITLSCRKHSSHIHPVSYSSNFQNISCGIKVTLPPFRWMRARFVVFPHCATFKTPAFKICANACIISLINCLNLLGSGSTCAGQIWNHFATWLN